MGGDGKSILTACSHRSPWIEGDSVVKNLSANARDSTHAGLIPGSGKSPGVRNGNRLQDSCLENSMDRGAWQVSVLGVAKTQTQLSNRALIYHYIHPVMKKVFDNIQERKKKRKKGKKERKKKRQTLHVHMA